MRAGFARIGVVERWEDLRKKTECPGHGTNRAAKTETCAVPGGLNLDLIYPPLKRWAIIFRARGARVLPFHQSEPSPTTWDARV